MKKIKLIIKKIIPRKYHNKISSLYNYLRSLFLFGFKYKCIFCKGHFRKLLPIGLRNNVAQSLIGGGYRYSLCPRCHSTDRERLIYWYIINKTKILNSSKNIRLLHVAPEKNLQKILKNFSHIKYISGDLSPLMNCDIILDITDINFEDNYFDFIICIHVLEHIHDDRKAMSELFRVLQPGGEAILQVPISKNNKETFEDFSITTPEGREKYFGQKDHVRIYGNQDYKNRLESVGFKVDLYDIKKDLSSEDIEKCGFNNEELLYICHKIR
ncbi:MAG: hypothetical protein Kow00103_08010 [Candidatus Caldatribacteriota bacterium]